MRRINARQIAIIPGFETGMGVRVAVGLVMKVLLGGLPTIDSRLL